MYKLRKKFNEKTSKATSIDYIIIGIIIIAYGILSFINLGSLENPQSFYTLNENESIIFEFSDLTDIIRIKYYNGELAGKYYLYVSSDDKKYTYIKDLDNNDEFSWNETKILQRVKYVKILAKTKNSSLGEVGFYDNKKELIPIKQITSSVVNKDQETKVLIDEPNMIPQEISYLNSTYFDEIYFARTAYDYANGLEAYEWTHPPLGKLLQSIPIKLFNTMAPFFYRLMGNIAGIIMIAVMYSFGLVFFQNRKYATFSALLMCFDCFHFAHTRMGTVDSFLVLFIMLSYYYMYKYLASNNRKMKDLFLSGLFFGLATSVKWTGLLAGLGLAILYFIDILVNKRNLFKSLIKGFSFFIVIPLTIYISCYLIFPNNEINYTDSIERIIDQNISMYNYHSKLNATHYFSSPWYTWPLSYKPVWYYNNPIDEYSHGTITGVGNIAIWWVGIVAVIYLFIRLFRKKDITTLAIIVAVFSMWLPYAFIGRVMFLYHYFPVLPFIMLAITTLFNDITERFKKNYLMPIYLIIVISIFILYYPAISGIVTNNNYLEQLKLLPSWYF